MPLVPLAPTDTRPLFRPVSTELIALLRRLSAEAWERPTIAGTWLVRDVAAHIADFSLRRLSFHRDRMTPPPPPHPIASDRDFVRFINTINAQWVDAMRRVSPRALTDMCEKSTFELAEWFEGLPFEAPALFGVSWAGEQTSEGWFDIGREFTELWHHQEQIRLAVGAPSLSDPRYLRAVLEIALRGLPHAFRDVHAEAGQAVTLDVSGPAGGAFSLVRETGRWTIAAGAAPDSMTRVVLTDQTAWKLLFNALDEREIADAIRVEGRLEFAAPLLKARSIVV